MNLYLISQDENRDWDSYDSAVVCAESEDEAREIHPSGHSDPWTPLYPGTTGTWASSPDNVSVELIGEAESSIEKGVVLASFNAG